MWKSDIDQPSCYFDRYIDRVDDLEILDAISQSVTELENLPLAKLTELK